MNNITSLTQQLVSIPSNVDENNNETKVADFIFDYLTSNSNLKLVKEPVKDGRYNILASNGEDVDTLVIGHTDTVAGFIKPTIIDNKLYGRGTTDMKGGIAAMMLLACQKKLPSNIGFLFYIDEEYSFLGMKQFIADYGDKLQPKTIISLDGSELEISNGCRGLIEIEFAVKGISCHAATPQNGISAINNGVAICEQLANSINTPVNIGLISGGTAPNLVADNCNITIDIRPSKSSINGQMVAKVISELAKNLSVKIDNLKINYNFGSWITPKNELNKFGLQFKDIHNSGYIDIQLLWEKFNKPVCFTIGAGTQSKAHTADEYVEIEKLNKLPQILLDIINKI